VKHDIAVVASHNAKQCEKFRFSTMSVMVCDDSLVMSVTVGGDPFAMSVAFFRSCS
jgi:hypothetical protein